MLAPQNAKAPRGLFRTGRPTQTRSTRLFRLFLFAIVGDVNSHAHLFPWIGLFVDLHNTAFKHVGMAETQQLRDGCVAIAGDVAKMHTLAVNRHGIGVVRVVGFGYEFELLAGLEFLSANAPLWY